MAVRLPLKFPATRKPVMLYDHDVELLQAEYAVVGYNAAVRTIVHKHCEGLRRKKRIQLEDLPNVRTSNPSNS